MRNRLNTIVLSLSLLMAAGPAAADGFMFWPADGGRRVQLARGPSLDDVVSGVRRRNPGRVLSADTVDRDGRRVHRVKVIDKEGNVRRFRFDGDTGEPLPHHRRDDSPRYRQQDQTYRARSGKHPPQEDWPPPGRRGR